MFCVPRQGTSALGDDDVECMGDEYSAWRMHSALHRCVAVRRYGECRCLECAERGMCVSLAGLLWIVFLNYTLKTGTARGHWGY